MPGGSSIQLFRILGIRVGVHVSWFFVLFLFIFVLSGSFRSVLDGSDTQAYVVAVVSALSFCASLVLHEFGHALVARRKGIAITGIDLMLFGGVANMQGEPESPRDEFEVAAAGPAVTLLVVGVCVGLGVALSSWHDFWGAATLDPHVHVTPGLLILSWLATINALVLAFNLVPAFPLDGGRIARAIAWKVTGDRSRATRFAAALGQLFSFALIVGGGVLLLKGQVGLGLWCVVLGMFIGQAARGAVVQTAFMDKLGGVRVADIMDREPVAVPADLAATQALDEFFHRYRWDWFPVVDDSGRFLGLVRQQAVGTALPGQTVRDVVDSAGGPFDVEENASIEALLGSEQLRNLGALMAVDRDGVLRGVVTVEQLRRALQSAVAPGPA